ncbi:hypothetical protein HMSSN139_11010 [Paenibacillus sp. HMSSN-139]|nr:hypothetical protein HMSSN139_11010 [Paenibacillus sp. HMSSN-139]
MFVKINEFTEAWAEESKLTERVMGRSPTHRYPSLSQKGAEP